MVSPEKSLAGQLEENLLDFLKVDLALGLTFVGAALKTSNVPRRQRNQENARKVFDTIMQLKDRIRINRQDATEISENLDRLRAALKKLGEEV